MFHFHQSATNQLTTFVEILLSICFCLCIACFFMLCCNITVSLFISYHSLVFLTLESLYCPFVPCAVRHFPFVKLQRFFSTFLLFTPVITLPLLLPSFLLSRSSAPSSFSWVSSPYYRAAVPACEEPGLVHPFHCDGQPEAWSALVPRGEAAGGAAVHQDWNPWNHGYGVPWLSAAGHSHSYP